MAGVFSISWSLERPSDPNTDSISTAAPTSGSSVHDAQTAGNQRVSNRDSTANKASTGASIFPIQDAPPFSELWNETDSENSTDEIDNSESTSRTDSDGVENHLQPSTHAESPNLLGRLPFIGDESNALLPTIISDLVAGDNEYSPIVFSGIAGTGKSFLARILLQRFIQTREWERSECSVCPSVDFHRQVAQALETNSLHRWRSRFDSIKALVIDDLQELKNKPIAQRELQLLIDRFQATQRILIVTSSRLPTQIEGLSVALVSRLSDGICLKVNPPGVDARAAVLNRLADHYNVSLDSSAFHRLVRYATGTVPQLFQAMHRICFETPQQQGTETTERQIDLEVIDRALGPKKKIQPTIAEITKAVAQASQLRTKLLVSQSRKRAIVQARGIAMYLSRQLTDSSLEKIGEYFGGRDHTTVLHGCRTTEERINNDPVLQRFVADIARELDPDRDDVNRDTTEKTES